MYAVSNHSHQQAAPYYYGGNNYYSNNNNNNNNNLRVVFPPQSSQLHHQQSFPNSHNLVAAPQLLPVPLNMNNNNNNSNNLFNQQQLQQQKPCFNYLHVPQQSVQLENQEIKHDYPVQSMAKFIAEFAFDVLYEYVPPISEGFISKLIAVLEATRLSKSSVILAMTYLYRKKRLDCMSQQGELQYNVNDEKRIFLYVIVSLMISNKYNDDNTFTNRSWSNATGIQIEELNAAERYWLISCDYDLHFGEAKFCVDNIKSSFYAHETRPWLLSISGAANGLINPHRLSTVGEIYAKDSITKKLNNGLTDYQCIETMYSNYEPNAPLRSPTIAAFEQQQHHHHQLPSFESYSNTTNTYQGNYVYDGQSTNTNSLNHYEGNYQYDSNTNYNRYSITPPTYHKGQYYYQPDYNQNFRQTQNQYYNSKPYPQRTFSDYSNNTLLNPPQISYSNNSNSNNNPLIVPVQPPQIHTRASSNNITQLPPLSAALQNSYSSNYFNSNNSYRGSDLITPVKHQASFLPPAQPSNRSFQFYI